jgi:hypothetical protein
MAYVPLASQIGARYTLTSPTGDVAVFNDPTSPDYVGMLTEVTGLDSAEVRESAVDLVEADGGAHGYFYFGRRPIVLSGKVFGHASISERNIRMDRARRASLGLRGDCTLAWTPAGGLPVFTTCRRQQPFRESGNWVKDFQIPLVSEYAVIFGATLKTSASIASGAGTVLENQGNYAAYPIVEITGAAAGTNNPTFSVTPSGGVASVFRTTGLTLASGEKVEFDMLNHTGRFTAGARNGQSANRYIDFAAGAFPALLSGNNTVLLGPSGTMIVKYRDTWA